MKIAIVFDKKTRTYTTGIYTLRALQEKHEVTHFEPEDLPKISPGAYDVYMNIDDGKRYRFPRNLQPSIFWAIDTHMRPDWYLERAPDFTLVFCAQKNGAARLREAGIPARWCPLACDPDIHKKLPLPKILDISFVGNFGKFRYKRFFWKGKEFFRDRARLISILKRRYNLYTGNFYLEEMAVVFSISKMVFNRSAKDDVNMRVFEALSCGSLLVTNHIEGNGQDLLFRNKTHLIAYQKKKDLIDSVDYYLHHEKEREEIAARGREEVLKKHTYAQRVDYMLSFLTPHTAKQFDFSGVHSRGDEWVYEQAALAQVCRKGERGIDVGCGPRKIVDGAIGIDILRKESQADILSSGDTLPLAEGKMDYVVASHNLEHYEDIQRTLGEWKRVLRKGGILGIVVPDDRIIDTLSLNPQHKHALTPNLLKEQIRQNQGWEIEILQEIVDAWSFGCVCRKL